MDMFNNDKEFISKDDVLDVEKPEKPERLDSCGVSPFVLVSQVFSISHEIKTK